MTRSRPTDSRASTPSMPGSGSAQHALSMSDPRVMDPDQEIVNRNGLSAETVTEVASVLQAMRRWSDTERRSSEAAQRYMRLGDTDMRALRYLLAAERHARLATPSSIAAHLGITPAATTKLLDRLESGSHITRSPHPQDRRSMQIHITEETKHDARHSVGRNHARRFDAIAALSAADRAAAIRFLTALVDASDDEADADITHTASPEQP